MSVRCILDMRETRELRVENIKTALLAIMNISYLDIKNITYASDATLGVVQVTPEQLTKSLTGSNICTNMDGYIICEYIGTDARIEINDTLKKIKITSTRQFCNRIKGEIEYEIARLKLHGQ